MSERYLEVHIRVVPLRTTDPCRTSSDLLDDEGLGRPSRNAGASGSDTESLPRLTPTDIAPTSFPALRQPCIVRRSAGQGRRLDDSYLHTLGCDLQDSQFLLVAALHNLCPKLHPTHKLLQRRKAHTRVFFPRPRTTPVT
jgi:hypothetical protein